MEPVSLTIRIPPDLHQQLQQRAKQEDRTLASLIRVLLAQAVHQSEEILTPEQGRAWLQRQEQPPPRSMPGTEARHR